MNLSHYDLFTAFDLFEAAHLAAGVEPQLCLHENKYSKSDELFGKAAEVKAIIDAMGNGLQGAYCNVPHALLSPKNERKIPEWALIPTSMGRFLSSDFPCFTSSKESKIWAEKIYVDAKKRKLIFDRSELQRWFGAKGNGFKPKYEFVKSGNTILPEETSKVEPDALPIVENTLGTKERNTLLTIIAALCKEAKLDYTKPAKTAGLIQSTAAGMGLSIGESTIEGHLKKITNALESRMK